MRRLKIFLGNSPWYKHGHYGVRAGSRWPHFEKNNSRYLPFPFFLAYAASLLEKEKFDIQPVDGIAERMRKEDFILRVKNYNPDLVVLEVSTPSIETDLSVARDIRSSLGPKVKIAFCGLHSFMYETEFLKRHPYLDFILIGEYEYTLLDLVKSMEGNKELKDVEGLVYRRNKYVYKNKRRVLIKDLDELPWPTRHLLPMNRYFDNPCDLPEPSAQMWASRGCPYECIFCWTQIIYGGSSYRTRNHIKVVEEMEYLVKKMGFKSVYFDDDTFNLGKDRILKMCEEIKKRGLCTPWAVMARPDIMDEEMLKALRGAGLVAIKYGIESGSQNIIDKTKKNLKLDKARNMVRLTKALGIKVHLTFMLGLPQENEKTVKETIDLALELDPDSVQFSIATPFPGSKYYRILDNKGYLSSKNWQDYDGYATAVIKTDELSADDLRRLRKRAYNIWHKHKFIQRFRANRWLYVNKGITHPLGAIRKIIMLVK